MSMTQCSEFSIAQCERTMAAIGSVASAREVI
jgi:hypothetical protein